MKKKIGRALVVILCASLVLMTFSGCDSGKIKRAERLAKAGKMEQAKEVLQKTDSDEAMRLLSRMTSPIDGVSDKTYYQSQVLIDKLVSADYRQTLRESVQKTIEDNWGEELENTSTTVLSETVSGEKYVTDIISEIESCMGDGENDEEMILFMKAFFDLILDNAFGRAVEIASNHPECSAKYALLIMYLYADETISKEAYTALLNLNKVSLEIYAEFCLIQNKEALDSLTAYAGALAEYSLFTSYENANTSS